MRVLISAYACEPGKGSEPGAGFATLLAALSEHEVWLVTRSNNIDALEASFSGHPARERLHLVGFDLGEKWLKTKKTLGALGTLVYYDAWQRRVAPLLRRLDAEHGFDVVHHATFASHWARIGAASLGKPLVIGPVGGSGRTPLVLWPVLGLRGVAAELARRIVRPIVSIAVRSRKAVESAAVVLLQNPTSLGSRGEGRTVLPNGLVGAFGVEEVPDQEPRQHQLVCVGRLIGFKGYRLAIEAMSHLKDTPYVLHIYGDGWDRRRLERLVRRRGLVGRVRFHGHVVRDHVLASMASAGALLHPALHEESSVTVGEALALGTPVVCMNLAGPPELLDRWPGVPSRRIDPARPSVVARRIASAVVEVAGKRVDRNPAPARGFEAEVLAAYDAAARS